MMTLSIIVLNYNTKELTLKCIRSIVNKYREELKKKEVELIVVDNASTDKSISGIKGIMGTTRIKILRNKTNLGFGKGVNKGAKKALGKYLLFLNSDTEVGDKGFMAMVAFLAKNPKIGILGGKLKNPNGSAQASTGKFYTLWNLALMLFGGERLGLLRESPKTARKVDWVSGACMMIRADLFRRLSGFDENFFMYVEDMELCFRGKKMGFEIYFYPNIDVVHEEHGSSNRGFAVNEIYKGLLYFYKEHKSPQQFLVLKFLLISKAIIAIVVGFATNNTYLKSTYSNALKLAV